MPVLSRFSKLPKYFNPVLRPLARWVPPLAVLHHRGRRSGTPFDTPVQAFRTGTGFIVGLAYHSNANWALNILAAGGGTISRGGRRYTISRPRRRGPEARADLAPAVGFVMGKLDIDDFLEFDATRI
ncbi:nitroreductase family deazaflavin-dependent oxidoreductase [Streptomyces sp. NBC_00102]|uniref:nitroreductase family deazaflavin-dependent oxidoreductase n=1 Tax=Streptomyces sp. NBC_00102 TaxID=2975652 RepID=UPI00225ACDE4|nr:nitroreductase family deazaflavin-dependent oxidoreductase [Streptomyces sp. NBC_00102]MCX5395695.1 nitroreductase family deazaflavin-dependent oxidoreductase [Streptomyces sp. NBC_00102]